MLIAAKLLESEEVAGGLETKPSTVRLSSYHYTEICSDSATSRHSVHLLRVKYAARIVKAVSESVRRKGQPVSSSDRGGFVILRSSAAEQHHREPRLAAVE